MARKSRRGGFLGSLVNQAAVPLTILGMQQTYHKKRGGKHTMSHKGGKHNMTHKGGKRRGGRSHRRR
jgi:hypothetical protein